MNLKKIFAVFDNRKYILDYVNTLKSAQCGMLKSHHVVTNLMKKINSHIILNVFDIHDFNYYRCSNFKQNDIQLVVLNELNVRSNCKLYLDNIFKYKHLFNPDCVLLYISINSIDDIDFRDKYKIIHSFSPLPNKLLREYFHKRNISKTELDKFENHIKCYLIKM